MRLAALAFGLSLVLTGQAPAQEQQTLADIRQELTVLHVEIQRLKREFSTTGAPTPNLSGNTVLERVDAIETELQRLTGLTEQLNARIDRIVSDGTNRVGDLEFRLCELEPNCDIGKLSETSTLGGTAPSVAAPAPATPQPQTELAVGEQAEFEAARQAFEAGDYRTASDLLFKFDQSYPGSPLAAEASLMRGKALEAQGDTREAARAYLASFTGDSTGPVAAEALFKLGSSLGKLGQTSQACVTLGEVSVRFPNAAAVVDAGREMSSLGCS